MDQDNTPEAEPAEPPVKLTLIIENESDVAQIITFPMANNVTFDMQYAELLSMTEEEVQNYKGPKIEKVTIAFEPEEHPEEGYFSSHILTDSEDPTPPEVVDGE